VLVLLCHVRHVWLCLRGVCGFQVVPGHVSCSPVLLGNVRCGNVRSVSVSAGPGRLRVAHERVTALDVRRGTIVTAAGPAGQLAVWELVPGLLYMRENASDSESESEGASEGASGDQGERESGGESQEEGEGEGGAPAPEEAV
jgi:hypothetical protein